MAEMAVFTHMALSSVLAIFFKAKGVNFKKGRLQFDAIKRITTVVPAFFLLKFRG